MQAFIPSNTLFLFPAATRYGCQGVTAYSSSATALSKTSRRKNVMSKNQYFRVNIPDVHTFLDTHYPIAKQPPYVLKRILAAPSLSLLYTTEAKDFMDRLAAYLAETGNDNSEAAQTEINTFYEDKRRAIKDLNSVSYINLIKTLACGHSPAIVSSYFSHIGIPGLSFHENIADGKTEKAYLLFNPRRDVLIKEIIRVFIPETSAVS
jgi:hypothetical protein